jgi:hypothetical protein
MTIKLARKIASMATTVSKSGKGGGSKRGTIGRTPMFMRIHSPNQVIWTAINPRLPTNAPKESPTRSEVVLLARNSSSCFART